MRDVQLRFLELVLDEMVKARTGLRDARKQKIHPLEKRKLSSALAYLDKTIELMTEVVQMNHGIQELPKGPLADEMEALLNG